MQTKTTRAFRTISEASDELDLQPHVLRFWESKFPQIKPIKRGGGRRFYRPDDIEFLRGIKTLLHDEKHPIKDVQKLIRVKGATRISELGRSVEKAAKDRDLSDTDLVPKRIRKSSPKKPKPQAKGKEQPAPLQAIIPEAQLQTQPVVQPVPIAEIPATEIPTQTALTAQERTNLEDALTRLKALRAQWAAFKSAAPIDAASID
ncbi:MAG: MerR family transcriptional regulator [Litorimonas sp.]